MIAGKTPKILKLSDDDIEKGLNAEN